MDSKKSEKFGQTYLNDTALAWARTPGNLPTVVFLCGLRSDMEGSKAVFLRDRCRDRGQSFLRLDYSGHGRSGGSFLDGTVSQWTADAAAIIDAQAGGPVLLVGSSLGGWIALLLAQRWGSERVRGLIGVAAAPDFTEDLLAKELTEKNKELLAQTGTIYLPSAYGEPLPMTAKLLSDGRNNLLLRTPMHYAGPVHLLQGKADADVPWRHAQRILDMLPNSAANLTLIDDGDHRLSRPEDLATLWCVVESFLEKDGA